MSRTQERKRLQRWEAVCGASCFVAGIVAPVLGLCLLSIEWLAGIPLESWLHVVATTLLVVGIPLILFAGFCLDWAEAKPKEPLPNRTSDQHGVLRLVPIVAVLVLSGGTQAEGQQTIFNVPTTDVLDRGKVYLELDASLKPTDGEVVPKFPHSYHALSSV